MFTTAWRNRIEAYNTNARTLWLVDYVTGEVINALAAEGPIYNEDFTQMTVKLREGCQWSDGVPITADDIVYGIELCMQDSGMSYNAPFNLYVDKVYKTDDYTVVFEFKEPNARFHANFIDRWGGWRPFPKHIFEEAEDPLSFDFNPPISSGHMCSKILIRQVTGLSGSEEKIGTKPPLEYCTVCPNLNMCFSTTMEMQQTK